jgi:hypothetical protein
MEDYYALSTVGRVDEQNAFDDFSEVELHLSLLGPNSEGSKIIEKNPERTKEFYDAV